MTLPEYPVLPPLPYGGFNTGLGDGSGEISGSPFGESKNGLGDGVEEILFDLKFEAITSEHLTDTGEIENWIRREISSMLESAKKKKDEEYIFKFENALARLPRFNNG